MHCIPRHFSMFKQVSLATLMLVGAASVNAAVLPAAQNWSTTSAEVDVQGLAFQLIDLDVNDGITPQIMFADDRLAISVYGTTNDDYFYQSVLRPANDAFPVSSSDISLVNPDGGSVASMSATGLYAGTGYSEALMTQNALVEPGSDHFSYTGTGFGTPTDWRANSLAYSNNSAQRMFGPYDGAGMLITSDNSNYRLSTNLSDPGFTVTPNTAVVFSGTLSSRSRIDLSQLSTYDPQTTQALARAVGSVELYSATPNDGRTSWSSYQEALAAVDGQSASVGTDIRRFNYDPALIWGGLYSPPGLVGPETTYVEQADSRPFALTFTNDTLVSKGGFFAVNLQTESIVAGLLPVPEPSTYALMALGLLGVVGAVRGRKAPLSI